jgi:hypothetical protein
MHRANDGRRRCQPLAPFFFQKNPQITAATEPMLQQKPFYVSLIFSM